MHTKQLLVSSLAIGLGVACGSKQQPKTEETTQQEEVHSKYVNLENEDSVKLTDIRKLQQQITYTLTADIETDPVSAKSMEDAADDPAIWVHPTTPSKSIVYGSNKRGGIVSYNLQGEELKYYPIGRVNNIDILEQLSGADSSIQLLSCSNRSSQSVDLYFISREGELSPARKTQLAMDSLLIDDVYGFTFGKDLKQEKDYLFVNGKNGRMLQYLVQMQGDSIHLNQVRSIEFGDQTEGMVADNTNGLLYVGAENTGVWRLAIDPTSETKELIKSTTKDNPFIQFDIEGLSIATYKSQTILMISSQGNFSYALVNLSDADKYLGSIKIMDDKSIDGTEDTDGIDVTLDSLNETFPHGIFIVQDGYNFEGDTLKAQNFKFIDFKKVEQALEEML